MQDFEFTVEAGELLFLQSRTGKRTPWAALHIAVDLVRSRLIRSPRKRSATSNPTISTRSHARGWTWMRLSSAVASAVPAGTGCRHRVIALDCDAARAFAATRPVILVRADLTTDDLAGVSVATGILTAHGGRTSHAAVVARQLGKVCLAGCSSLAIDDSRRRCAFGGRSFAEGDVITLDGDAGLVYEGAVPTVVEWPDEALATVRHWQGGCVSTRSITLIEGVHDDSKRLLSDSVWCRPRCGVRAACGIRAGSGQQQRCRNVRAVRRFRHGPAAKGDGPLAAMLKTRPADLTSIASHNRGTFPAEQVAQIIDGRHAVKGTAGETCPSGATLSRSPSTPCPSRRRSNDWSRPWNVCRRNRRVPQISRSRLTNRASNQRPARR